MMRLGGWVSCRSRLFELALVEFLKGRRQEHILARLNEVYSGEAESSETMLLRHMKEKVRGVLEDWC
jgi:hypothetical protein